MAFSIGHLLTAAGQGATGYLQGKTEADRRREERERQARQEAMQQSMFDYRKQQDDAARRQQELTNKRLAEAAARAQAAADRQVEDDDREKTAAARGEASENELAAYYALTYPDKIPHGGVLPARQAIKIGEAEDAEARMRSRPERPTVGAANAARSARYQDAVGRARLVLAGVSPSRTHSSYPATTPPGQSEVLEMMIGFYPEMSVGELSNAIAEARSDKLGNERTEGLIAGKSPGAPSAVDLRTQSYLNRRDGVAQNDSTPQTEPVQTDSTPQAEPVQEQSGSQMLLSQQEYDDVVAESGAAYAARHFRVAR